MLQPSLLSLQIPRTPVSRIRCGSERALSPEFAANKLRTPQQARYSVRAIYIYMG
jgi:hypothetical protein